MNDITRRSFGKLVLATGAAVLTPATLLSASVKKESLRDGVEIVEDVIGLGFAPRYDNPYKDALYFTKNFSDVHDPSVPEIWTPTWEIDHLSRNQVHGDALKECKETIQAKQDAQVERMIKTFMEKFGRKPKQVIIPVRQTFSMHPLRLNPLPMHLLGLSGNYIAWKEINVLAMG